MSEAKADVVRALKNEQGFVKNRKAAAEQLASSATDPVVKARAEATAAHAGDRAKLIAKALSDLGQKAKAPAKRSEKR